MRDFSTSIAGLIKFGVESFFAFAPTGDGPNKKQQQKKMNDGETHHFSSVWSKE